MADAVKFPRGETVQRFPFRAKALNAHRQEVIERGAPIDVRGVGVAPGNQTGQPSASVIELTLYLEEQDLHSLDQWRVRGRLFDVEVTTSDPWRSPHTGRSHGQAVGLRRAQG